MLAVHYFVLREVFLRHSLGRGASIAVLIAVALAIPWPPRRRALSLAIAAALAVAFLASVGNTLERNLEPEGRTPTPWPTSCTSSPTAANSIGSGNSAAPRSNPWTRFPPTCSRR